MLLGAAVSATSATGASRISEIGSGTPRCTFAASTLKDARSIARPHLPQNRAPGFTGAAQCGQDSPAAAVAASGCGTAAAGAGCVSGMAHFGQKRAFGLQSWPQTGQLRPAAGSCTGGGSDGVCGADTAAFRLAPQPAQKRAPFLFSAWHSGQFTKGHFQVGFMSCNELG